MTKVCTANYAGDKKANTAQFALSNKNSTVVAMPSNVERTMSAVMLQCNGEGGYDHRIV